MLKGTSKHLQCDPIAALHGARNPHLPLRKLRFLRSVRLAFEPLAAVFRDSLKSVPTLAVCLQRRQDNFLLLRLLAAALVIVGHSYAIVPGTDQNDIIAMAGWGPGIYSGSIAVDVFFVISGFLVAGSYVHRQNLGFFIRARILRIVPACLVCVLALAWIIGPLISTLPLRDYLAQPEPFDYVWRNLTFVFMAWNLPGVFAANPYPDVVNGSLWTLPAEVRMYVLVALFGWLGLLQRRWLFNAVVGTVIALALLFPQVTRTMFIVDGYPMLAACFVLGAIAYVNRRFIPVHGALNVLLIVIAYALHESALFLPAFALALSYSTLWIAYAHPIAVINRLADYSYGLYLWGFPVQQMVMHLGWSSTPLQNFLWSLPITLLFAIASWHLIEKPVLRFKQWPLRHPSDAPRESTARSELG